MAEEKEVTVYLEISAEDFLQYYAGAARQVMAKTSDGQSIQFPASILRKFVGYSGISGYFVIRFDQNNKFISIQQLT